MTANKHTPMVVAAARALCRRNSELCNVDFEDNWKLFGDGFLMDAQLALESAAAPELLDAWTMGVELNAPDFLDWIADRLERVHGENPLYDYMHHLRNIAKAGRAAIAKATGGAA